MNPLLQYKKPPKSRSYMDEQIAQKNGDEQSLTSRVNNDSNNCCLCSLGTEDLVYIKLV